MVKGVFVRFGFDAIRISQIQRQVKTKQQRTPHEVYYIQPSLASNDLPFVVMSAFYILTLAWGFQRCSFRLVGQCESLYSVERVTRLAPRFFMYT